METGNSLDQLILKVEHLKKILDDNSILKSIISLKEGEITELNTENQLFERGINSEGRSISSYAPYSKRTISIKRKKGQPYNRVTLRDTGDFHRSFRISSGQDSFQIGSPMSLADELSLKYGDFIFGLTEESKEILRKSIILPGLLDLIHNEIL